MKQGQDSKGGCANKTRGAIYSQRVFNFAVDRSFDVDLHLDEQQETNKRETACQFISLHQVRFSVPLASKWMRTRHCQKNPSKETANGLEAVPSGGTPDRVVTYTTSFSEPTARSCATDIPSSVQPRK
jgi:hypothetical protein